MICGLQILILSSVGLQIRRNGAFIFSLFHCITASEMSSFTVRNKAKMRFLSSNLPFGLRMQNIRLFPKPTK